MKKLTKFLTSGLLIASLCTPAFASASEFTSNDIASENNEIHFLTDQVTRSEEWPTSTWDLNAGDYNGQFDFGSNIMTNAYFYPLENGWLHIEMDAVNTLGVSNGKIKITCYEKTLLGKKEVESIYSTTSASPSAHYTFMDLEEDKKYFFNFEATPKDSSRYHYVGSFTISG